MPPRVEGIRALDVLLGELLVVLRNLDVQPAVGDDAATLDRVVDGMGERNELGVDVTLGKLEAGRPAHGLEGSLACPLERVDEHLQLAL